MAWMAYARFALEAKIRLTISEALETDRGISFCYGWYFGEYLYIGKTSNLRQRTLAHLVRMESRYYKLGRLALRDMEVHVWPCENIFYASILESKLIVKHKPKYNKNY